MDETRRGLEIIVEAASTLLDFKSMQRLAEGVLTQIASLLNVDCAGILVLRERRPDAGAALRARRLRLLPATTAARRAWPRSMPRCSGAVAARLRAAAARLPCPGSRALRPHRERARGGGVHRADTELSSTDRALIEVFCSRLSIAFDNVILYEQLQEANAPWRSASRADARADLRQQRLTSQWAQD